MRLLWIALGGALGTVVRYGVSLLGQRLSPSFPIGTLAVNVVGCFVLAGVAGAAASGARMSEELRLAVAVGFCGGLTTYSTFNQESLALIRDGANASALAYLGATVVLCAVAGLAGLQLARALTAAA
jgi:fluoride exporter